LEKLQLSGSKVNITIGKEGRAAAGGLDTLARSGLRVGFMLNMVESAYMRQTMATLMANNAQERYNTVVARYGRNSEEARKAARQMETQMDYLNLANNRANISTALLMTQFALQTGILKKSTWATIQATAAKYADTIANKLSASSLSESAIASYAHTVATKLNLGSIKQAITAKFSHVAAIQVENAATKSSIASMIAHKVATTAAAIADAAHVTILKAKAIVLSMASAGTLAPLIIAAGATVAAAVTAYAGTRHEGGYIPKTGRYDLLAGEWVLPKGIANTLLPSTPNITTLFATTSFNFETHLHVESDLESALSELNRKVRDRYRSVA